MFYLKYHILKPISSGIMNGQFDSIITGFQYPIHEGSTIVCADVNLFFITGYLDYNVSIYCNVVRLFRVGLLQKQYCYREYITRSGICCPCQHFQYQTLRIKVNWSHTRNSDNIGKEFKTVNIACKIVELMKFIEISIANI